MIRRKFDNTLKQLNIKTLWLKNTALKNTVICTLMDFIIKDIIFICQIRLPHRFCHINWNFKLQLVLPVGHEEGSRILKQWGSIRCKLVFRWQHLSQIKARLLWLVENVFFLMKTQQAISGTSAATCQLMEPHCFDPLGTSRDGLMNRDPNEARLRFEFKSTATRVP